LSLDLVGLGDCADSGDYDPDLVNSIFRGAHSLKGLAGMFGYSEIAELAHNLENLLDSLRLGKVPLGPNMVNVLFDSMELLGTMVRSAGTTGENPDIAKAVARINDCVKATPKEVVDSPLAKLKLADRVLNSLTEYEEHRLLENIRKGRSIYSIQVSFSLASFDQDLGELIDLLKGIGEVISTLPSAGMGLDSAIDFELLFGSDKGSKEVSTLIERDNLSLIRLGEEEPTVPVLPLEIPSQNQETSMTAKSMSRTVRVDIGKLDDLMNIVGELVLSHSMIAALAGRLRQEGMLSPSLELGKTAKVLERKLSELQKGVMDIRMIPIGQLFEKMTRIVRKISKEQDKKVDLKLFGADTELDKLIVEDISDPLMHIIRNAIDHGIETPAERLQAGKEEKGSITLSSFQKGNHVVIQVEDDGAGIDAAKIKSKALEKKLISSSDALTDREALEIIFHPGFSTSETVSEISGRGVGMDVVKTNIAALSGMVDVDSQVGVGTKLIITLPITLAIIKALIVSSAERTYALPITSVLETILVESTDIRTVERKEVIQLRDTTLPLLNLARFFGIDEGPSSVDSFYVVVVGVAEKRLGIMVNDLVGQQDIVIKSIGDTFKGFKGISGAADLGDQRTILVLDVGGIINEAARGGS
jgi:two-component system chemotaxis sensor kinase CheA